MTDTIVTALTAPPAAPADAMRRGWIGRAARSAVLSRLRGLRSGRVTIHDPWGAVTVGDAGGTSVTVHVQDASFYRLALTGGALGVAEAYIRGLWSCDDLAALLRLFVRQIELTDGLERGPARLARPLARLGHLLRPNSRRGSRANIRAHYDVGNDLFALFLDETMTYSAAIFERPDATLAEASVAKLDRLCRKLDLQPDDHLLEIGTGWGSLALHAAGLYGCRVTTTTISRQQHELARQRVRDARLEDRVTVLLRDYRELEGRFDKLVSIEMIEAVGHRYLPQYFRTCARLLAPDGLMAVQAITMPDRRYGHYRRGVDFIQRYVFPGSCVPSVTAMLNAAAGASDLRLVHLEDITPHYTRTLREWRRRFTDRLADVRALGYPERFARLWEYYLCYCEAGFSERYVGSVQMTLSRPGNRRDPILPARQQLDAAGAASEVPRS